MNLQNHTVLQLYYKLSFNNFGYGGEGNDTNMHENLTNNSISIFYFTVTFFYCRFQKQFIDCDLNLKPPCNWEQNELLLTQQSQRENPI